MSFLSQPNILAAWASCMCAVDQCNWDCQQTTIQNIIDSALFNPGNASGVLNNDGNGNLSWVPLETTIDYFLIDTASSIATYKQMTTTPASVQSTITTASVTDTQILQNWATNANVPDTVTIPSGLYLFNIHAEQSAGTKTAQIYVDLVECNSTGTDIAIIGTTGYSTNLTGSQSDLFVTFNLANSYVMASITSRLVARVRIHVTGSGSAPTVILYYGGATDSHITIPATASFGGIVPPNLGGTGQDTSGSTGVPQINSGTWSVADGNLGAWVDWSGSLNPTGFAVGFTINYAKYAKIGKTCILTVNVSGTSNATTKAVTLPFNSKTITGNFTGSVAYTLDNGATVKLSQTTINTGVSANTLNIFNGLSGTAWTAAGSAFYIFTLTYETT